MDNMRSHESYLQDVLPDKVESILEVGVSLGGVFNIYEWGGIWDEGSLKRKVYTDICDGCYLPFDDDSFDVVISIDVIEYIHSDMRNKFISELERVSRDLIYITTSDETVHTRLGHTNAEKSNSHQKYVGLPSHDFFGRHKFHFVYMDTHHLKMFKRKISSWNYKFYDMEDYVKMVGVSMKNSVDSVLDCGTGQKGVVAQKYYENKVDGVGIKKGYACDIWTLKKMDTNIWTWLKINALTLLDTEKGGIGEKSVDIVQAFGFLEHLTKNDGYIFLKIAERVARKAVILSAATFVHGTSCTEKAEMDGNPYHEYRSVWHWKDFEKLGYKSNIEHMRQGLSFSEEAIAWKIIDVSQMLRT